MKTAYLIVGLFWLIGCSKALTNDQIIAEVKKCHDAGLDVRELTNTNNEIIEVQCTVPNKK